MSDLAYYALLALSVAIAAATLWTAFVVLRYVFARHARRDVAVRRHLEQIEIEHELDRVRQIEQGLRDLDRRND